MKEHGYTLVTDLDSDRVLDEYATVKCCHCGGHFPVRPGSGLVRGWCNRCKAVFCGPGCEACVPEYEYLTNLENGLPPDFCPVIVPTS